MNTPSMFDSLKLDTPHIKIRSLNTVGWEMLAKGLLYENSFHARNWGIKTPADVKKMYETGVRAQAEQRGNAIVFLNRDKTEVLGMTNFMNVEPAHRMIEIGGTWISKKWQRSFVNTETKYALLQYCFEVLKLQRVEFKIDAGNKVSQTAVQRLGFQFEGQLYRRKINANQEPRDYVIYSVTDLTWSTVKNHIAAILKQMDSESFEEIQKIKMFRHSANPDAAFKAVQDALKKYPQNAELNYLAACICDADRTENEAVPYYLRALELNLNSNDKRGAYLGLASTYRSLGKYAESKRIFLLGINEFPEYRPYYVFLALTEFNLSNSAESIKLLLHQLIETTNDQEISAFQRALRFYSTRLSEVFE